MATNPQLPGDMNNYAARFSTGMSIKSSDTMLQFLKG